MEFSIRKMSKVKHKKQKTYIPWGYCLAIAIVVLIFCVAFIHFDNESENNTRSVTGTITNLEYDDDKAKAWFRFEINGESLYYQFYDRAKAKEDFKAFEVFANDKTVITVAVTEEKDFLRMFFDFNGADRAVSVESDTQIYFDIGLHNKQQTEDRIICIVIASLILVGTVAWFVLMEIYLGDRSGKRKKRQIKKR